MEGIIGRHCLEFLIHNRDESNTVDCNVTFELNLQVEVVDWMKGQTCGLCGKADGEIKQEFRMPNGHLTKNAVTYAHSWILAAESCKDNSGETEEGTTQLWCANEQPTKNLIDCLPSFAECRIKLDSVELEKQAVVYGQESRCFSVEPVLRCLPGCFPVKTTSVTVGFHCVAAGGFTPTSYHQTKSCWLYSHFFWLLRRFQCEQIWGSQRNPREENWPEGKSWCSPGLQLYRSVCLNTLFTCHVFHSVSKSFKIKFH